MFPLKKNETSFMFKDWQHHFLLHFVQLFDDFTLNVPQKPNLEGGEGAVCIFQRSEEDDSTLFPFCTAQGSHNKAGSVLF